MNLFQTIKTHTLWAKFQNNLLGLIGNKIPVNMGVWCLRYGTACKVYDEHMILQKVRRPSWCFIKVRTHFRFLIIETWSKSPKKRTGAHQRIVCVVLVVTRLLIFPIVTSRGLERIRRETWGQRTEVEYL